MRDILYLSGSYKTKIDKLKEGIEPEKDYKGSFNVRISPELHKNLALYSAAHNQSLNTTVEVAIEKFFSTHTF